MMTTSNRALLSLILCGTLPLALGSSPAIGMAIADGSFQLDHSRLWDNATLFAGSLIETNQASLHLRMQNGAQVNLSAEARAQVFDSHLVLEGGIGELKSTNYRIDAARLRVSPDAPGGIARVQITDGRDVVVAAYEGSVRVTNDQGVLVAKLDAGRELLFQPEQEGGTSLTKLSGCLQRVNGSFVLTDVTTGITVEVRGSGLEKEVGQSVEISGTADSVNPSARGTSQIVYAHAVSRLTKGGCTVGAKPAAAAGPGAAAAGGGLSHAAIAAIVGGVAVGGSLAGLAAVKALPGQSQSQPQTSR